jgi:membrane fusion protein, copper/silver efflux system
MNVKFQKQFDTASSGLKVFMMVAFLILAACNGREAAEHNDTYTCPMHPTVLSDRPGNCPVCGMDLVRQAREGEEVAITEDLSKLIKSPNEMVTAGVKTLKGEYKSMAISIEAHGMVTYDSRNISTISARAGGRIEKAFLKYPYQSVTRGQKIAEIYSPELINAQRDLLFLLEHDAGNQDLINAAKERLAILGASTSQISTLIKTGEVGNTIAIYSPYEGYVADPAQKIPTAPNVLSETTNSSMSGGMNEPATRNQTKSNGDTDEGLIKEGTYVTSGQPLFKIINTSSIRVEFNVKTSETGVINKGNKVLLDFGNEHQHAATVDFVQPFFNEGQEFLTIRAYTSETEDLHIGHLVRAVIESKTIEALWIPKEAVVDLGVDKVVFIKQKDTFTPKKIITGMGSGKYIEVKSGLSSTDEFAENAQFLVDSESFIKTK